MTPSIELVLVGGSPESTQQALLLPGVQILLGRSPEAAVRLLDERASRKHATLELSDQGVFVTDLGGTNGTLLNGSPLPPRESTLAPLPASLQIGSHVFRIQPAGAAPVAPAPPRLREDYEHVRELGRGAHGSVSLAVHRASGRQVAIKTLHAEGLGETIRQRFLREGQVRIDCPQVAQVYEVREEAGAVYIVMELVPGQAAHSLVQHGPLPMAQALHIGLEVAKGLVAAHRQRIVHRDIKPSNILVTPEGVVKIVDFGIAKLRGEQGLTNTGQGIGTMAYIAPEQASDAKRVDPAADLYSLGATLYHLIAGKPPFDPRAADFIDQLYDAPPPRLQRLRPDCPRKVAKLVHELLEKDPMDRATNAKTLARRLEALLREARGA